MSARAFDVMAELPAIFAAVDGLELSDINIGYQDPRKIEKDLLPRVLIFDPVTEDPPPAPSFGLRSVAYGFSVIIANVRGSEEATQDLAEAMAAELARATLVNADRAYMNPGSTVIPKDNAPTAVTATIVAEWEGV